MKTNTTHNNAHLITFNGETRGTLTYIKGDYTHKTVNGWFTKHHGMISMRKIGGRNRFAFINPEQIIDFVPYVKPVKATALCNYCAGPKATVTTDYGDTICVPCFVGKPVVVELNI